VRVGSCPLDVKKEHVWALAQSIPLFLLTSPKQLRLIVADNSIPYLDCHGNTLAGQVVWQKHRWRGETLGGRVSSITGLSCRKLFCQAL